MAERWLLTVPDLAVGEELQRALVEELGVPVSRDRGGHRSGATMRGDPLALAQLLLTVPISALATVTLADRLGLGRALGRLQDRLRGRGVRVPGPGGGLVPLEDVSIPDLLELAELAEDHTPVWDVFLAYSRADRERVTALQAELQAQGCTVFRDETGVKPGQDWPFAIRNAQRAALCTVVVLSRATPAAHYLRDEIQRALSYRRKYGHHVIPVGLDGIADAEQMPSGLMVIQAIDVPGVGGVAAAAELLAKRVAELRRR